MFKHNNSYAVKADLYICNIPKCDPSIDYAISEFIFDYCLQVKVTKGNIARVIIDLYAHHVHRLYHQHHDASSITAYP